MKNFNYLIENFFTNKDFLAPANQIPGTLFSPLHFIFSATILIIVVFSSIYLSKRKHLIKSTFIFIWAILLIWEFIIIFWESISGKVVGLDLKNNLSLYPCSLFLYTMPFAIWGKGYIKKMACGSICTLGLIGGAINFLYPAIRLSSYSCISFVGLHTFSFHAAMIFTFLVMQLSGYHSYKDVHNWWELFLPCVPTLLLSIPANIINYSYIQSDYMFFRGKFPLIAAIFGNTNEIIITILVYIFYIILPMLFYLPAYVKNTTKENRIIKNI